MIVGAEGKRVSPRIVGAAVGFGTTCPREFVIEAGMTDPAAAVSSERTLPTVFITPGMIGAITVLDAAAVFEITFPFESVATVTVLDAAAVFEITFPFESVATGTTGAVTVGDALEIRLLTAVSTPATALLTAVVAAPPALLTTVSTPATALLTAVVAAPPALLTTVSTPATALLTAVVAAPPALLTIVLTPPAALLMAVLRSPPTSLASVLTRGTTTPLDSIVELGATFGPKAFVKAV